MFATAIEKSAEFTCPIHTISRTFNGKEIIPGSATLFMINDEGYALTCKHVVETLLISQQINENYARFRNDWRKLPRDGKYKSALKGLKLKYKIDDNTIIQQKYNFLDCVDRLSGFTAYAHPTLDLALIKFNDFNTVLCKSFPVFKKDSNGIKSGDVLCRLGYPFPEFKNFRYNEQTDDIDWISGINASPRFPIEGMVTRFLGDGTGKNFGIELSTPGLKGQSGGPLFDSEGIICGMQYQTKHLHLGFDIEEKKVFVNGVQKTVSDYSFIHLGECIHVDIIKAFMREHKVKFQEA